jgi:hypothetical protein
MGLGARFCHEPTGGWMMLFGASGPANAILLGEDGVNRQQSTAITVNRQVCPWVVERNDYSIILG